MQKAWLRHATLCIQGYSIYTHICAYIYVCAYMQQQPQYNKLCKQMLQHSQ